MLQQLDGYKTYIGAIGIALMACGKAIDEYYTGKMIDFNALFFQLGVAFSMIGIGHKIERKAV